MLFCLRLHQPVRSTAPSLVASDWGRVTRVPSKPRGHVTDSRQGQTWRKEYLPTMAGKPRLKQNSSDSVFYLSIAIGHRVTGVETNWENFIKTILKNHLTWIYCVHKDNLFPQTLESLKTTWHLFKRLNIWYRWSRVLASSGLLLRVSESFGVWTHRGWRFRHLQTRPFVRTT